MPTSGRHYRKITAICQGVKSRQWSTPESSVRIWGMPMGIGKQVGCRIKQFREARGLTQSQLAELIGKSIETISNFERGKVITSLLTLERLARPLEVRVKDFFSDDGDMPLPVTSLSKNAQAVKNAATFMPEDDLEIVAGLIDVLESRRRRKRS